MLDIGVYESFGDGECGGWKMVETIVYFIVGG